MLFFNSCQVVFLRMDMILLFIGNIQYTIYSLLQCLFPLSSSLSLAYCVLCIVDCNILQFI